jgi:HSP20 family molecular chaperone IbpA
MMNSSLENNREMHSPRGSAERWLLVMILLMQVVITRGIFRKGDSAGAIDKSPVDDSVATAPQDGQVAEYKPVQYPFGRRHRNSSDPFEAMDAMMADAFRDMAQFRSAVHMDDGWDRLSVSPTMDMRSSDSDYIVSLSIPGVNASNVNVSLNGRVLTVQAQEPVNQNSYSGFRHFERRILLPGSIGDADDVRADMTNGLLRVYVPKGSHENQHPVTIHLF